jgi:ankyrin repeat protein
MSASKNGHKAIVRLLIDKGADVNVKGQKKDGSTALILTSENGHEAVARLLINKGAGVNAQDSYGSTALVK